MVWRICAALGALFAWPGLAVANIDNWTIYDFGSARTEAICMKAAEESLSEYAMKFGAERIVRGNWVVYAWGLTGRNYDAVISCGMESGGKSRATLVVYATDSVLGGVHADRLWEIFKDHNARLGTAYVQDALDRAGLN